MDEIQFILFDHQNSMSKLKSTMERVGAKSRPNEFIRIVSNVYHAVESEKYATDMPAEFKSCGSYAIFKQALLKAKSAFNRPVSVLDLGCGTGYDLDVLQEVYAKDEIKQFVCADISSEMLNYCRGKVGDYPRRFVLGGIEESLPLGPYDLIITHSLVHHIPNLVNFFESLRTGLEIGGGYVMGHEPNKRFWNNPECMSIVEQMQTSERRKKQFHKYLEPQRYVSKITGMMRSTLNESLEGRVNRILQKDFGFANDLTPQEIHRLVDVHIPDGLPGQFKIGLDGFDWGQLQKNFLQNFELKWVATTSYMGKTNPAHLPQKWQEVNRDLAVKYPLDGAVFSAFWKKDS